MGYKLKKGIKRKMEKDLNYQKFMNNYTRFVNFQAMSGFIMMMTQQGKLLYISENAAEYLGHSMVKKRKGCFPYSNYSLSSNKKNCNGLKIDSTVKCNKIIIKTLQYHFEVLRWSIFFGFIYLNLIIIFFIRIVWTLGTQ